MNSMNAGTNSWLSGVVHAQQSKNLTPLKTEQPNPADANSTKAVDKVSFSQKLQETLDPNSKPKSQGQMIIGDEMIIEWGIMILGGKEQIQQWAKKGLVIKEDTYRAINDAFSKSSKEIHNLQKNNPNRSFGATFNPYQIVQDNQPTPDWFEQEKQAFIQATGDPKVQAAFREGKQYMVLDSNGYSKDALAAYRVNSGQVDKRIEDNKRFEILKKALEGSNQKPEKQSLSKVDKPKDPEYEHAPDNRVVEGTSMGGL